MLEAVAACQTDSGGRRRDTGADGATVILSQAETVVSLYVRREVEDRVSRQFTEASRSGLNRNQQPTEARWRSVAGFAAMTHLTQQAG